ncbi:hypothetical protein HZC09_06870 [Candidatus Micrarchaeota archaeon]|nr:hypothetical protein [Candidatus Micrarchaeota archaeon]
MAREQLEGKPTGRPKGVPKGKLHPVEHVFTGLKGRNKIILVGVDGYACEEDLPHLHDSLLKNYLSGNCVVATIGSRTSASKETGGKQFGHLLPKRFRRSAKPLHHYLAADLEQHFDKKAYARAAAVFMAYRLLKLSREGKKPITAVVPYDDAIKTSVRLRNPSAALDFIEKNRGLVTGVLSSTITEEKAKTFLKNVRREFELLKSEQEESKNRPHFFKRLFSSVAGAVASVFRRPHSEEEAEKHFLPEKPETPPLGEEEEKKLWEED